MSVAKRLLEYRATGERPVSFKYVCVKEGKKGGIRMRYAETKRSDNSRRGRKESRAEIRRWERMLKPVRGRLYADALLNERGPYGIPYRLYLRTTHWQEVRLRTLERDEGRCCSCGRKGTETHHRTYERLGCELPGDTVTVCRKCHHWWHKEGRPNGSLRSGMRRKKKRKTKEEILRLRDAKDRRYMERLLKREKATIRKVALRKAITAEGLLRETRRGRRVLEMMKAELGKL